ncbi:hypothetical protein QBC35DRAFT_277280 [Podospora australis]|uniref:Uncharacterized protein n=1 Tax=Podospora australis TaxID=1536484 RepID=A0AAN7ANF6_9PEZI|nr:hypothetical protein QBC35DRAFT_277280 [Podospora australis]
MDFCPDGLHRFIDTSLRTASWDQEQRRSKLSMARALAWHASLFQCNPPQPLTPFAIPSHPIPSHPFIFPIMPQSTLSAYQLSFKHPHGLPYTHLIFDPSAVSSAQLAELRRALRRLSRLQDVMELFAELSTLVIKKVKKDSSYSRLLSVSKTMLGRSRSDNGTPTGSLSVWLTGGCSSPGRSRSVRESDVQSLGRVGSDGMSQVC